MLEEIKGYRKEFVFDGYSRIVENFKDYEKISKVKMLEEVYNKVYNDYNNIIDICTARELKYLKMIVDGDIQYKDKKYEWERRTLQNKFILVYDFDNGMIIPEEIEDNVIKAVNNVKWNEVKKKDSINEVLVGFCKVQGSILVYTLIQFGSGLLDMNEEELFNHVFNDRLFRYYVDIFDRYYENLGEVPVAFFNDYYYLLDELDEQRRLQGVASSLRVDIKEYKTLFYNDFNVNRPIVKKFVSELEKLPFYYMSAVRVIKECALLNIDREELKNGIKSVPVLSNYDLTNFFKLMDKAMDEMPSGALNGATPNELKNIKVKEISNKLKKEREYIPQNDACLSKTDAKLFYKLYFGVLDFTNRKYNIKKNYKIYNKTGINPYDLNDIIDKFWKLREEIITEFCEENPFKFNDYELNMVREFKKGFRDSFVIVSFEEDYTTMMKDGKVYMVKGINANIDKVISFEVLPYMVETAIMPFKDFIIYDGILISYPIKFGVNFHDIVYKEFEDSMKYYHL